jgi:NAD(P)-dependent dehydrogenase (short-subunit alcohol dehydrogenase family)
MKRVNNKIVFVSQRVENKVAIVTGGAKGIGEASCRMLAKEGAFVVVTDIDEADGRALAVQIQDAGNRAEFRHLDTSDEAEVQSVVNAVYEEHGRIDVLVNNAGISGPKQPTHEIALEDWQQLMDVNLKGVFLCTKHVVRCMLKSGGGSIVNLSSIAGLVGIPTVPPYCAAKGAVRLMTKADALLYAKDKIRVNSIHPAYIWTPMVEALAKETGPDVETFRKQSGEQHPVGHMGEPDDIAYGVLYLASDESKFMTGAELVIDGGYTCQ